MAAKKKAAAAKAGKAGKNTAGAPGAGEEKKGGGNVTMKTVAHVYRRTAAKIADALEMCERDTKMDVNALEVVRSVDPKTKKVDFSVHIDLNYKKFIESVPIKVRGEPGEDDAGGSDAEQD